MKTLLVFLLSVSMCLAADYQPESTVTIDPSGDSVTLAWTQEGGWPSDMGCYHTAAMVLDVDGVLVQAETGGIVWTCGDTVFVNRLLTRRVFAGQCVTVVYIEAGTAFSESMSDSWRTWAIAGTAAVNGAGQ